MYTSAVTTPCHTSPESRREHRRAPAGRIIKASVIAAPTSFDRCESLISPTHAAATGRARGLSLIWILCASLVGIGALTGSGFIGGPHVETESLELIVNEPPASSELNKVQVKALSALSVRETASIRATSAELPYKRLQQVTSKLEVPRVQPVAVRYRERLASFTTSESVDRGAFEPHTIRRAGETTPSSRYLPSNSAVAPTGTHLTSRVLSIIKKHAPKNRNAKVLAEAIVRESLAQDYDPLFVAAVIKTESLFNPVARSNKGAQGLMQIMPATGAWLAHRESLPRLKLTDTRHNLQLGITYLKQLEDEYNGDRVFTLVAYNWGPGHVEMASGGKRRIPGECLRYAVRILNDYRRWKTGVI